MDSTFDNEADAIYIRLSENEVETNKKIDDRTIADVDKEGEIVGIEILEASKIFQQISSLNIDFLDQSKMEA